MQPRHQVNVVGDPSRQLLRCVHVRVYKPYTATANPSKKNENHHTQKKDQNFEGGKDIRGYLSGAAGSQAPTWKDDAATKVEGLHGAGEGGEDVGGGAHSGDAVAGDGDSAVPEDAERAIHGDDDRVVKNGIDRWRVGHLRGLSFARRRERPYDGAAVDYVLWRQPAGRRGKWNSLIKLSVTFLRQVVPS